MNIVNFTENVLSIFRRIAIAIEKRNKKEIDWEQRRYEVAKAIYVRILPEQKGFIASLACPQAAVVLADDLINELKKKEEQ